jgi:hypothetical protein
LIVHAVRSPIDTPYLSADFGGATFFYRGAVSAPLNDGEDADSVIYARMNVMACALAEQIPANRWPA